MWALTRDLAEGLKSQNALAAEYGVSQGTISNFKADHRPEIDEMREKLTNAYAGLWAAEKAKRIAALQQDVDDYDAERGEFNTLSPDARRVRQGALKAIAEELGDLPQRIRVEGGKEPVKHVLEGVNTEDLS